MLTAPRAHASPARAQELDEVVDQPRDHQREHRPPERREDRGGGQRQAPDIGIDQRHVDQPGPPQDEADPDRDLERRLPCLLRLHRQVADIGQDSGFHCVEMIASASRCARSPRTISVDEPGIAQQRPERAVQACDERQRDVTLDTASPPPKITSNSADSASDDLAAKTSRTGTGRARSDVAACHSAPRRPSGCPNSWSSAPTSFSPSGRPSDSSRSSIRLAIRSRSSAIDVVGLGGARQVPADRGQIAVDQVHHLSFSVRRRIDSEIEFHSPSNCASVSTPTGESR